MPDSAARAWSGTTGPVSRSNTEGNDLAHRAQEARESLAVRLDLGRPAANTAGGWNAPRKLWRLLSKLRLLARKLHCPSSARRLRAAGGVW